MFKSDRRVSEEIAADIIGDRLAEMGKLAQEMGEFPMGGVPRSAGSVRFHEILCELGGMHDRKQRDYGTQEDPFANVRASSEFAVPAWVGCMIRANDKMKRLQTYARTGHLGHEGVEDAFRDLAVYAIIGLCLFEEARG